MPNPFPIMWLSQLAYFILRFFIAVLLLHLAGRHLKQRPFITEALAAASIPFPQLAAAVLVITELIVGFLLLLGLYTQYAAIIGAILCLKIIILKRKLNPAYFPSRYFYILMLGGFVSLFITGAGAFAFDLPL